MFRQGLTRIVLPLALAACVGLPAIAAAQGIPEPHAPVPNAMRDLTALRASYEKAYNAKDVKVVDAMFAPDATMIGPDGSVSKGWAAIAKANEASASSWSHITLMSDGMTIYGSTAVDMGTMTIHPASGTDSRMRYMVVLRHDMHGWKLLDGANVTVSK